MEGILAYLQIIMQMHAIEQLVYLSAFKLQYYACIILKLLFIQKASVSLHSYSQKPGNQGKELLDLRSVKQ